MFLAAIDLGTNSSRLLIAEKQGNKLLPVCRKMQTTRLGSGLSANGRLHVQGKKATLLAVASFLEIAESYRAAQLYIMGTSALRQADDGAGFCRELAAYAGCPVEVLSAEEEAYYSYTGVRKSLSLSDRILVFDLGGGSCELIWQSNHKVETASYLFGALNLTEQYFRQDPPQPGEIAEARGYIQNLLDKSALQDKEIVGTGGTVTALASVALGLSAYDPGKIHGYFLPAEMVQEIFSKITAVPASARALITGLPPERAPIMPAGTLVVNELLAAAGAEGLVVSEEGLLLGRLYAAISQA